MEKKNFNKNWRFRFQDGQWNNVTLPHDAQLLEKRSADAAGGSGHGYFPGNIYEYEKNMVVPMEWKDKHIELSFEGIYKNATVYLNHEALATHKYGYTGFTVSLGEKLRYGAENLISVVADNSKLPNSRWYTGGGIYRPVSLLIGNREHVKWQGVRISTVSVNPARVRVETDATGGEVTVEILDHGVCVATANGAFAELEIPNAKLWSEETPYLYSCKVTLKQENCVVDTVIEKFGIRQITWSTKGLFVNGKETLLRGGCVHHDHGIVGAASFPESEWRRVKILKESGYNAIRSSHNPASTAMLEACDALGMYVMDETFDMWYVRKTKYDYGCDFRECWESDTKAMVNRDYNHPSVIMYSIGNEVSEPGKPEGVAQGKKMIDYIKALDDTRAVTGGMNLMIMGNYAKGKGQYDQVDQEQKVGEKEEAKNGSLFFNTLASFIGTGMNKAGNSKKVDAITSPILDALDIAGYNYANGRYPLDGTEHPNRIVVGSETFPYELGKNWKMVKKYPYLIGDFMWTCWDYLGETGIGAWSYTGGMPFNRPYPWILGAVGTIDILGNGDSSLAYARTVWGLCSKPAIGVRPVNHPGVRVSKSVWRGTNAMESWSWKNCNGNKAEIEVFSDAFAVELLLNQRIIGKKKVKDFKAMFHTKYEPGTLTAIAYDSEGKEVSRSSLSSAIGATTCAIRPEKKEVSADEVVYVNLEIVGENGILESNDDRELKVSVEGGELLGFGSANPCHEYQYHTGIFSTYYGRAQLIARAGDSGTLKIKVADGEKVYYGEITIS